MVTHLSQPQIQGQKEEDNMITETLEILSKIKKPPKKASKELKFAFGNDYLPFSFRDMIRHLKKLI